MPPIAGGLTYGILISSIFIDLLTLAIVLPYKGLKWLFIPPKKIKPTIKKKYSDVAIIIPAYNEEQNIGRVIYTAFNQTIPPKKVIVVDDHSTDNTAKVCRKLKQRYPNLVFIRQKKNRGKAYNTGFALFRHVNQKITIILDADTFLAKNYIEEITKPFVNRRVVISTGVSLPVKHKNLFAKIIYHGSIFQYKFFIFRKWAQGYRNAVSVVTGDSAAYRTKFLKAQGGLPQGTQTEDMDITWAALEKGYRVAFQSKANARSKDAGTLNGHWNQLTRWYAGGFQCWTKHSRNLWKAKPLLLTTLIPVYIDSLLYGITFLIAPLLFFVFPLFTIGFYIADFIFTVLAIILVEPKSLLHLPEVYLIKFIWSFAWLYAAGKTGIEVLGGKREWVGRWARDNYYFQDKSKKK